MPANSEPIITNSIFYANAGGEIINDDLSFAYVTYSIIQGGYAGTGNLDTDPLLLPLGSYGGFTRTMPLAYGSPAIDAGTNTGCPSIDQRGFARPQDGDGKGIPTCDMGATESRILSKTFPSLAAQDGVIRESSEISGIGSAVDAANITFAMGDDALDRQGLSILSFSTAVLPDTAPIVSARLNIKQAGLGVGINPFTTHGNILVDVRKGPFSNNAALQPADFQALSSKPAAMTILNNPTPAGLYSGAMPSGNLIYINKLGLTQFRLRFTSDDNDDMHADYLKFYSGNYAVAGDRPVLTVSYYMP